MAFRVIDGYTSDALFSPNTSVAIFFKLLISMVIMFALPAASYILAKIGILEHPFMKKYRKHALLLTFIVASMITLPDALTLFIIAVFIYIIYEASILVARFAGSKPMLGNSSHNQQ